MYELLLETTNGNDGFDPLQYQTVRSLPRPHVHWERVDKMNTILLYIAAKVVQEDDRKITIRHRQRAPKVQWQSWRGHSTETRKVCRKSRDLFKDCLSLSWCMTFLLTHRSAPRAWKSGAKDAKIVVCSKRGGNSMLQTSWRSEWEAIMIISNDQATLPQFWRPILENIYSVSIGLPGMKGFAMRY